MKKFHPQTQPLKRIFFEAHSCLYSLPESFSRYPPRPPMGRTRRREANPPALTRPCQWSDQQRQRWHELPIHDNTRNRHDRARNHGHGQPLRLVRDTDYACLSHSCCPNQTFNAVNVSSSGRLDFVCTEQFLPTTWKLVCLRHRITARLTSLFFRFGMSGPLSHIQRVARLGQTGAAFSPQFRAPRPTASLTSNGT